MYVCHRKIVSVSMSQMEQARANRANMTLTKRWILAPTICRHEFAPLGRTRNAGYSQMDPNKGLD